MRYKIISQGVGARHAVPLRVGVPHVSENRYILGAIILFLWRLSLQSVKRRGITFLCPYELCIVHAIENCYNFQFFSWDSMVFVC